MNLIADFLKRLVSVLILIILFFLSAGVLKAIGIPMGLSLVISAFICYLILRKYQSNNADSQILALKAPNESQGTKQERVLKIKNRVEINNASVFQSNSNAFASNSSGFKEKFSGREKWRGKGELVKVGGYEISGLIYTGRAKKRDNYYSDQNYLIDPSLKVTQGFGVDDYLGYYPSYEELSSYQRNRYLKFLSEGAKDKNIDLGYVFLYFYGLENRLIREESWEDYDNIVNEVIRLRSIYAEGEGYNRSFHIYSRKLLSSALILKNKNEQITEIIDFDNYEYFDEDLIKLCISELVMRGKPIPAELTLKGVRKTYYSSKNAYKRTRSEFDKLFIEKFNIKYKDGFKPKPLKGKFTLEYQACSGSFRKEIYRELPKVVTDRFANKFLDIIDSCLEELDEYSRHLGKNPDDSSLYSKSILPVELALQDDLVSKYIKDTRESLVDEHIKIANSNDLYSSFKEAGKLTSKEYSNISEFHSKVGLGMIPSQIYGDNKAKDSDNIIIFELPDKVSGGFSSEFKKAKNILDISVAVANADSIHPSELLAIQNMVDSDKKLTANEKAVLKSRITFLEKNPSYLKSIKSKLAEISEAKRKPILEFLVALVLADGRLTKEETKVLQTIFSSFGYDEKDMYSSLHNSKIIADDEPVLVKSSSNEKGFKIPKQESEDKVLSINMDIVNKKKLETKNVSKVLAEIFSDEESKSELEDESYDGLDGAVAEFFALIMTKDEWERDELEAKAKEKKLFLGSVLEKINDWAIDNYEETIIDDDGEFLIVNKELVA